MNNNSTLFENIEASPYSYSSVLLNKSKFIEELDHLDHIEDIKILRNKILPLQNTICHPSKDSKGLLNIDKDGDTVSLRRDVLKSEFEQIIESQTIDRAKYYINRLKKGLSSVKTSKINDINLLRWKEYDNILTDSLWIMEKRDKSGVHIGDYWGNFIPQIPHQLMLRYTKLKEWVFDPFLGSGTTLIEAKRLGRNAIGIELQKKVKDKSSKLINSEDNNFNICTEILQGDSRVFDLSHTFERNNIKNYQLAILHPPYHDIIKFSDEKNDLSNAKGTENFLEMFGEVIENTLKYLQKGRYLAIVIGDKYSKGEWIPLGFYCMQEAQKRKCMLKSIIVKNFDETKGKRNQKDLWRYRALVGGFYIFKHEYIFIFKK